MDTLTVTILVVTLLALVAPIIEIAVKRPKIFLEMTADARAFAEAPLHESAAMRSFADDVREVEEAPVDVDRLAGNCGGIKGRHGDGLLSRRPHPGMGKVDVPDPLEPRTDVPQTVQRVISRNWSNATIRSPGGKEDGETGAALAELIGKITDTAAKQGSDTRVHHGYPPDYVVVAVHDDSSVESLRAPINTTMNSLLIHYEWEPFTPVVTLFKRNSIVLPGGSPIVTTSINVYSRSDIWKHTIAPDEAVFK